ncbi:unnamed protein product [Dicrocoelium dendriticum]|nr:unnamed protein product [Dicrocoelium dendriticum]
MSDDAGLPGVTATATASTSLGSVETNSTTSEASSTMHQNPSSINDASTQQTNTSTPSLFQLCKNSVSDIVLPPGEEENRNKIEPLEQTSSPVLDLPSAAAIEDGITSSQECESAEVEDADRTEEIVDDEDPEEEDEIEEEDDDTESVVSHLISPALEQEREMRKAEDRKLLALLAHFDEEQLNRFEAFRRATFAKASVRRLWITKRSWAKPVHCNRDTSEKRFGSLMKRTVRVPDPHLIHCFDRHQWVCVAFGQRPGLDAVWG